MNFNILERFSMRQFYLALMVVISAVLIGNLISLLMTWRLLNIGGKISGIAGLIMTCLWFLFFLSFFMGSKAKPQEQKSDTEIIDIINKEVENLKGGEDNGTNIRKSSPESP